MSLARYILQNAPLLALWRHFFDIKLSLRSQSPDQSAVTEATARCRDKPSIAGAEAHTEPAL